ncbi:ATP-binding protein, partial [bacterium]|nr:ATP-binding protein [bacterium]
FPSIEYIIDHFTDFWNLLFYESIADGSLDAEFGTPHRAQRELHRVADRLFNADLPLQRNRFNSQLHPLISKIFENIADQDQLEILQSCYVHSASLKIVANDLNVVITDTIPRLLRDEGAEPIQQSKDDAGRFGRAIERAIRSDYGQLFLLLGGIGSGKTTFLKRYQRTVGKDVLAKYTIWFHIDFLRAPLDPLEMEEFVWRSVLNQLRERYVSPHLETRRNIKRVYKEEISALKETALSNLREGADEFEKALSPYLSKWQENIPDYVSRLLSICKPRREINVVIFIDNVDQLPPDYQAQIFQLAQRITRSIGGITIVVLREESYYAASIQKTFTAYTNRKFHIASPRFRVLIGSRIKFALGYLKGVPGIS